MTDAKKIKYQCDHSPGSSNKKLDLICEGCLRKIVNQRLVLLEFVKETDFIDCGQEQLEDLARRPDDSYARRQAEYVLQLKRILKEIGEL